MINSVKKCFRSVPVIMLALSLSLPLQAEPVRMGTFTIPLMVESANQGMFIHLAETVAAEAGERLEVNLFPTRRVREVFAEQNLDVIFPAIDLSMNSPYLATTAVYSKRVFAFTRALEPKIRDVEDMAGKRIGYTSGFSYSSDVLSVPGATYNSTLTDPQNIKKLLAGRIDVFISDEQSALRAIHELQASHLLHYDAEKPLSSHPVFFAFQPTERGAELRQRFDHVLQRMASDGRLAQLLSQTR